MNRYFYTSAASDFVLLTTVQLNSLPFIIENDCTTFLSYWKQKCLKSLLNKNKLYEKIIASVELVVDYDACFCAKPSGNGYGNG